MAQCPASGSARARVAWEPEALSRLPLARYSYWHRRRGEQALAAGLGTGADGQSNYRARQPPAIECHGAAGPGPAEATWPSGRPGRLAPSP